MSAEPARRSGALFGIYPILALLAFPTLGAIFVGTRGWSHALDVFDDGGGVTRLGIAVRHWSAHGLTLWNPDLTAGNAFLGQFALPPVSFDVGLAFLIGPFAAFAVMVWITSTLAGVGMHLFLRDGLGLSTPAAVTGGVIAVLGFWHSIYGISVAVLPLVLWLGDRAANEPEPGRRWRATVGAVFLGALALYAGHVQIVVFLAAIQIVWIVATTDRSKLARRLLRWSMTWAMSFGLYAPVLVTQLVLLPLSERSVWDLQYLYAATPIDALRTIANHYVGALFGVPTGPFGPSTPRYGTIFLGGLGLPLVALGIVAGRRGPAARFIIFLLVVIPAFDLAATIGAILQEQLGVLRSFQFVRIRHFFPFALAAAAALGVEVIAGRGTNASGWLARGWRRRLTIALMALATLPVAIQLALGARRALRGLRAFESASPLDLAWVLAAAGLAIGLAGGIALIVHIARGWARPLAGAGLLILASLFVAERVLMSTAVPLHEPAISTFDDRLARTAAQSFLLAQPGIEAERVLTFGDHANRMAFQGLRQADGYQAIYPLAYHAFFGRMTAPGLALDPVRFEYFHSWGARAYAFLPEVDPELVSLVGVRWLYVRAAPGTNVPTVPGLVVRFQDPVVTVYENPAALSRAFLVGRLDGRPDDEAVGAALATASLAELRATAFATSTDIARLGPAGRALSSARGDATSPDAGDATIIVDTPDHVVVDVFPNRAALLVLTDAVSPGWVAEVDGQPVPITTVDGAFRGVAIDAGARRIVFSYRPGFTALGGLAAGLALVVLAGWAVAERRRSRRTIQPSTPRSEQRPPPGPRGGDDV